MLALSDAPVSTSASRSRSNSAACASTSSSRASERAILACPFGVAARQDQFAIQLPTMSVPEQRVVIVAKTAAIRLVRPRCSEMSSVRSRTHRRASSSVPSGTVTIEHARGSPRSQASSVRSVVQRTLATAPPRFELRFRRARQRAFLCNHAPAFMHRSAW